MTTTHETDEATWTAVDNYYADALLGTDPHLEAALEAGRSAGLPGIQVSPLQGALLHLLARASRARRILELGTLAGYSTIWLARALPPEGLLISLEAEPRHAQVARANLDRAGLSEVTEVRVGPALETLPALEGEGSAPFDLVFIDADKPNLAAYLDWALRLTRAGGLVVVDNVVRHGTVLDETDPDPAVQGTRRFVERLAAAQGVTATAIQTVGVKGYDGFAVVQVGG
jgi:predicted O-methyltransferase YrrM